MYQRPDLFKPVVRTIETRLFFVGGNPQPLITVNPPASDVSFNPKEWNTKLQEGEISFDVFIEKLNELGIKFQVNTSKNTNKVNIQYEYNGDLYLFNVNKDVIEGLSTTPQAPSEEKIQETIKDVISKFAQGNMTYDEAVIALNKVGIEISTPLSRDDNDATQSYFEFKYKGVEYCVACNTEAIQNSQDNKTVTIWSQEEIKKQQFTKEQLNQYFQGVAWKEGAEGALYYRAKSNWPEGIKTPEELKMYLSRPSAPTPSVPTPSVPTFKEADLKDLDDKAIERYFFKNANGTYSFNKTNINEDFPGKPITTIEQLKEALAEKAKADGAGDTLQTYPSGYKTWDDCWKSILNGEIYNAVRTAINDDAVMKQYYESARDQLKGELQQGFETLTKDQIQNILIAKVNELKNADDYADVKDAATEISKDINKYIGSDYSATIAALLNISINSKINTNYSVNEDGTIKLTDSTIAQNAFDQIIKKINEIYEDAINKLGGETVLKQLVSAAWMQAANNSNDKLDFDSVPFKEFMDNVISNIKNTIQNLIDHPENIELLKQKPASQRDDITSNLPHYKTPDMDSGEVVYLNSNGNIDNPATQQKIDETKAELKKRLRAAYPYLSQDKIDSMLEKAFTDAISFVHNHGKKKGNSDVNVCGMTVRIKNNNDIVMSDLVDLALRYFDIELRSSGNFGEAIVSDDNTKAYNDAKAQEEADAKAAQEQKDAEAQAKYENTKSAAAEISKDINKYIGSDYSATIAALLNININSKINTNYSVNEDGTIKLTDSTIAQKAFDQIIKKINEIYEDAINKLGGETVLKQLLSAAWMQAANNSNDKYDFGSVPFKEFMDNVISNIKTIIKNLSSNPELLEFYTQTPASKNGDLTKNLTHYNTNDTNGNDESIGYTNGDVVSADQKDLIETKTDLKDRIRKAYPHIDGATLDSLVDKAFEDALRNLWSGGNRPTGLTLGSLSVKKHKINMDDLVNLALYYFDIELFDYISNNPTTVYKE